MREQAKHWQKLYRLECEHEGCLPRELLEFEAHGAECALLAISRSGTDDVVTIFEDERLLARVRTFGDEGAWWINPPRLRPA